VACWSTKVAISLKRIKIEQKLLWRAYRKSSMLFRFFGSPPYFYFRFRLYGHRDGRFCLIFAPTAQQAVLDGTNGLSSGKPCAYCRIVRSEEAASRGSLCDSAVFLLSYASRQTNTQTDIVITILHNATGAKYKAQFQLHLPSNFRSVCFLPARRTTMCPSVCLYAASHTTQEEQRGTGTGLLLKVVVGLYGCSVFRPQQQFSGGQFVVCRPALAIRSFTPNLKYL